MINQAAEQLNGASPSPELRATQPAVRAKASPHRPATNAKPATCIESPASSIDDNSLAAAAPTPLKVLLVASAGGHWIELCRICAAFAGHDCQYVSTAQGLRPPNGNRDVLVVADSSRDTLFASVKTAIELWRIVRSFQPDLVVSTGAAPGAAALYAAKLCGARTIWIDSIANGDEMSLSGRLVRPVADILLTQSEKLADPAKGISFIGRVM